MSRRAYVAAVLTIFVVAAALGLLRSGEVHSGSRQFFNERVIGYVRDKIYRHYVEEPEDFDRKLYYGALRGMTDTLDPHSVFLSPEDRDELEIDTRGRFGGLGIVIEKPGGRRGPIVVIRPFIGTPASKAGILPGDRIVGIDGESTSGMRLIEAVAKMRGVPGTSVKLKVRHGDPSATREFGAGRLLAGSRIVAVDGEPVGGMKESDLLSLLEDRRGRKVTVTVVSELLAEPEEIEIERAEIKVPNIEFRRIVDEEAGIGYVHLARFPENTAEQLREAIDGLLERGMRAFVLDLRGNGGGVLDASIEAAELFLEKGAVIVSTRARGVEAGERAERPYRTRRDPPYPKEALPLVILVDGSSASASEILAAAVRDNRRAVVVGERTFGKASVQKLFDIKLGRDPENPGKHLIGCLKLTTEKYYTPKGKSIQRDHAMGWGREAEEGEEAWGVEPDVRVEMSKAELFDLRRQWERDRIAEQKQKEEKETSAAPDEGERAPDPQLQRAVEILRAVLVLSPPPQAPAEAPADTLEHAPVPAVE